MASRRQFLWLALTGAVMSGVLTGYLRERASPLQTRPLKSVEGFRYLKAGQSTGQLANPLVGLDDTRPKPGSLDDLFDSDPEGLVPVASFSDYNCPYCRVLTKMLPEMEGIAITWHELPLLGESSVIGARAALAAKRQGAYLPMHERLMRSRFRVNDVYLRQAAGDLGIDAERLLSDMSSTVITEQLERSAGVAALFGIYGTPALVVGRTLVLGNIKKADLRQLIADEAQAVRP